MTAIARARPRGGARGGRPRLAPWLFLTPNMTLFALFTIGPALYAFWLSLFSTSPYRPTYFAGLGNYGELARDALFMHALRNSVVFVPAFCVVATVAAVALAVTLNTRIRGRTFFRGVFFVPVLLSPVVVGLVWRWLLDRQAGLLNLALEAVGLPPQPWLLDTQLALAAVILVGVWTHVGFYTLILLAGLQGIDHSLYEAASVDGATPWQQFRRLTVPLLRPTLMVVLILSVIAGFQAFDYIYVLTGGGPADGTTLMVQYIYRRAFDDYRYGLAAAASVVLFLVVFALTGLQWLYGRRSQSI